jgi:dolichyl-phosphate beta-glucosyltransferase
MRISIIIPAKDEEKRLPAFLSEVIQYCLRSQHRYEIIIVDDGSKDQTVRQAECFRSAFAALKVISLGKNYGKGYAVRQGMLTAQGDVALFLDADGSTKPLEIERNLDWLCKGYDVVIGSRVLQDETSKVNARIYRQWIGGIFNFLVSRSLIKGIKDTQCGFKMFKKEVIPQLFEPMKLSGFGFDLEILYLAQRMKLSVKEVPVSWSHVSGSKVHMIKDSLRMALNIWQIKRIHRFS